MQKCDKKKREKQKHNNIHVDVTAKVFQELNLALAEEEAGLNRHATVHGPVKTGQDLCLVLGHISAVLEFQQV